MDQESLLPRNNYVMKPDVDVSLPQFHSITPQQTPDFKDSYEGESVETVISCSSALVHVDLEKEHFGVEHKMKNPFVIIIGVTTYSKQKSNGWKHLPGVEKDIVRMKHLWEDVLQFDTKILRDTYPDCSIKDIRKFRKECISTIELKENTGGYDGLICIVSGHGTRNTFISGDGKEIDIATFFFVGFNVDSVEVLGNYPKVFLFDTCRGDVPPDVRNKMINRRGRELISCDVQDGYRISYATTPGKTAPANEDGGAFISAFYDVMITLYCNKKLHKTDFQTILRSTSQKAKIRTRNDLIPMHEDYTDYKIRFKCKYRNIEQLKVIDNTKNWSTMSLKRYVKIKSVKEKRRIVEVEKCEKTGNEVKLWLLNTVKLPVDYANQYYKLFEANHIVDLSTLKLLDKNELRNLGISSVGHIAIMFKNIEQLKVIDKNKKRRASICCCGNNSDQPSDVADNRCCCVIL
eukprot:158505_1